MGSPQWITVCTSVVGCDRYQSWRLSMTPDVTKQRVRKGDTCTAIWTLRSEPYVPVPGVAMGLFDAEANT